MDMKDSSMVISIPITLICRCLILQGAMYSTVRDLDIWDEALYLKQLISENMKQKMFQISQFKNYAYGWEVNDIPVFEFGKKLTSITHGGGINAFNSSITRILFKVRA
ncbi:beta-lactamase family protein [Pseudoalteromonas sp. NBT06-2]|uniref:beta-lactamase family protein n=1 Tax=Pseudoalteromonas sp. NBT06-2 TaxID=2025950 RepID=UPI001140F83B|nr:beta-lactamase family protein [Pseudoalteromonas sp. NBT06-2]